MSVAAVRRRCELTALELRMRTEYTIIRRMREEHVVYMKVGVQQFQIIRTDEGRDHAEWFACMVGKALASVVQRERGDAP